MKPVGATVEGKENELKNQGGHMWGGKGNKITSQMIISVILLHSTITCLSKDTLNSMEVLGETWFMGNYFKVYQQLGFVQNLYFDTI